MAGHLQKVAGIVIGKFTDCPPSTEHIKQFTLDEMLVDRCASLGVPVLRGPTIGHVDDQTTLPIGCTAELDAGDGTITLLEAAVTISGRNCES